MTVTRAQLRPRVLVTGASGFIGGFAAEYLQANGCDVRAAMRTHRVPGLRIAECVAAPDFSKPFDAAPLVDGMDHVVHLAGLAHATDAISETSYIAINAEAAARLASAAKAAGVQRFVLMSSVRAQTGPSAPGIVTAEQVPRPVDAYGRSKLAGERLVLESLGGSATQPVILRPVLVYGPGVKGNMGMMMRAARSPWPLPVKGFGARRSLAGRTNLAAAVLHAITAPAMAPGPYLVADDEALTVAEILGALRQGLGRRPGVFAVPQMPVKLALNALGRAGDLDRLFGDLCVSTGPLRATGWSPAISVRKGLAAAIRDD